ncbi:acyl-CoA dehydrogenase family protein [Benzoatithermus flavus]|uniref:Acyl-CoA dehydrogenase family protein n=1 Tax=Benzoatithermus flavus TaxID=3108223 RepID=A0ABU8XWB5_9PROT
MATKLADIRADAEPDLFEDTRAACAAALGLMAAAREAVLARVGCGGKVDGTLLEREQTAAHGLAWLKVYVEALRAMQGWAERLAGHGRFGERERLILQLAFAEYLARIAGGIPMNQLEYVRPHDLGLDEQAVRAFLTEPVRRLIAGGTPERRARLAELIHDGEFGDLGLSDDSLDMIREQFRKFAEEEVRPFAHGWHERDELIPMEVIEHLAGLGVFGLTIPEAYGGLGLSKEAMCVVTEELSRGYIGIGSLGTRTEIAGELIRLGGTDGQKAYWLPKLASGEVLPTAVFTEPNTGSDLASLTTRAVLKDGYWEVTGAKTWITHAARADLMTMLVRTDPNEKGYKGLSMLLGEKPRGTDENPFPVEGLTGGEIRVLGYRGMKEYTLSFDGFKVPEKNLLGGVQGQGFKQLMATFESARIQTAARAIGVAVNALELGLQYAKERSQFGKPLFAFPRVAGKLALMAVEIMVARQLTLFAAREKDADRRCDLEAGLAKLLGAAVAWAAADNALQIHGGNGYAMEYPISRVLCDARILNIFEGAAEIQAQVIARRLLEG